MSDHDREDFYELNDTDDQYHTMIGRIAVAWGHFERTIDKAIWTIVGILNDDYGACVTAQLVGAAPRLRAYISLVHLHDGITKEITDALNKFYADTEPLTRLRNRIIHDPWVWSSKTFEVGQEWVTADKRLDKRVRFFSIEALQKYYIDIVKHRKRFTALERVVGDARFEAWQKSRK